MTDTDFDDREWVKRANCRGEPTSTFFIGASPELNSRPRIRKQVEAAAKAICKTCPVKRQCYDYAIKHDCEGIWAGMTELERRRNHGKSLAEYLRS